MNVKRNFGLFTALIVAGIVVTSGCDAKKGAESKHPDSYSAAPIEGWVVDAKENKPLEGVIVVAAWTLYGGIMPGIKFDQVGTLELMESVTDENGRFSFPSWGPVERPSNGVLTNYDPQLRLFKPGYDVRIVSNPLERKIPTNSLRVSQWNGKTIKLKKFAGTIREYASRVQLFGDGSIRVAMENCTWKKIPKTIIAMRREDSWLRENGEVGAFWQRMVPREGDEDPCGARSFWNEVGFE